MSWEIEPKRRAVGGPITDPDWLTKPQIGLGKDYVTINQVAMTLFGLKLGTVLVVMTDVANQRLGFKVAASQLEIEQGFAICSNLGKGAKERKDEPQTGRISLPRVLSKIGIKARRARTPSFNQGQRIIEVNYAPTEAEIEADLQWEIEQEKKAAEKKAKKEPN